MIAALMLALAGAPPPTDYLCNYATIRGRARAAVRVWHADAARPVARLGPGTAVFACDDFWNDDLSNHWVQVRFADGAHPCPGSPKGLRLTLSAACRSGWVREELVAIRSG